MTKVDEAIRRALSADDLRAYQSLGREQSVIEQAMAAFQNQSRLLAVAGWAGGFLLFGAAAFATWRFLHVPEIREMLMWGAGATLALAGLGLVKVWFWLEMQKNAVLRELKRLELQVACLIADEPK